MGYTVSCNENSISNKTGLTHFSLWALSCSSVWRILENMTAGDRCGPASCFCHALSPKKRARNKRLRGDELLLKPKKWVEYVGRRGEGRRMGEGGGWKGGGGVRERNERLRWLIVGRVKGETKRKAEEWTVIEAQEVGGVCGEEGGGKKNGGRGKVGVGGWKGGS